MVAIDDIPDAGVEFREISLRLVFIKRVLIVAGVFDRFGR
jgi:hypothetical protein